MNNKKMLSFTSIVLLLTLVCVSLVSGTYAKYATTAEGTDTAVVAKWDVSDGDALANFDIFDVSKIYDTEGTTDYTAAGTVDTDVATGTTDGIIAPGTWGKFDFALTNSSDVNATYSIDYTVDEAGVFLQWSTDGTTWSDDLADVVDAELDKDAPDASISVYWKWAFEDGITGQSDTADTALGSADTLARPTVAVKVTFTQVD